MKRILVALDGSPRADGVLTYAVSLARATEAKLLLFRSFGVPPDFHLAWPLADEPLETVLHRQSEADLATKSRAVPPELLDGTRVTLGVPWQAVCTVAREENVDLIVVGSHGYGGIDRVLGTTAAKIVNHADRPVLVVRPLPST